MQCFDILNVCFVIFKNIIQVLTSIQINCISDGHHHLLQRRTCWKSCVWHTPRNCYVGDYKSSDSWHHWLSEVFCLAFRSTIFGVWPEVHMQWQDFRISSCFGRHIHRIRPKRQFSLWTRTLCECFHNSIIFAIVTCKGIGYRYAKNTQKCISLKKNAW